MVSRKMPRQTLLKNSFLMSKLILFISLAVIIDSCSAKNPAKNFYTREQLPEIVAKLSQEEFNLRVTTSLTNNTLWVYMPMEKILDGNFNFLESASLSFDHANLIIGRAILNSLNPPDFYVLVASDIKSIGLDYMIVIYTTDLKKYYYSRISRGEFSKRKVVQSKLNLMALTDTDGTHIQPRDINMHKFLAEQLKNRIEDMLKENFKGFSSNANLVEASFSVNRFIFKLDTRQTKPITNIDITKEALKIISKVLRDYDFRDFSEVNLAEAATRKNIAVSQKALFEDF